MKLELTEPLARAAAWDAANRSMRAAGRKAWSLKDYNLAVKTYNKLWPLEYDMPKTKKEKS